MYVHNVRDFPHAKYDSEINARFLSKLFVRKNNIAKRVHKTITQGCKL